MRAYAIGTAAALLFGACGEAAAQNSAPGRVTGTVHVANDIHDSTMAGHEVVGAASVYLLETPYTTRSDDGGRFTLADVPPGQYVLEARRIGFRPTRQVIRVAPDGTMTVQVHMVPAPVTVDAITVEALQDQGQRTYDLSALQKVPLVGTANVTAVTLRQIQQVHARDPWDLVREATGMEVHEQGQGPGFASDAVIRGFTSDHSADVALVVDGVPVNEPINGHGEGYADWNLIFPSALSDVQVIKGPISLLFGNFATGGAVNVTTQASTRQTRIQLESGDPLFGTGTLTTGFEKGAWGGFLGVHGVHNNGWRDNSAYDATQAVARVNRRVSPELLVDGGVQFYGTRWDSPGFLSLAQFDAGDLTSAADPTDGGDKTRFQGRLSAAFQRGGFQWQNTAWGYGSQWHLYLTIPELGGEGEGTGSQTEEIDNRGGFGGRSIARWSSGSWELTAGAEGQWQLSKYGIWQTVSRQRDLTLRRFRSTFTNEAGLLGATKTFGRAVRLEGGVRVDALQPRSIDRVTAIAMPAESHVVVQPKFGTVLYATGQLQFYGSAARGFRNAPGTISDPTKAPGTEWAFEGGARLSVDRLDGSLAFFRLVTRNEFVYNPITLMNENTGHSTREGIEAEVKFRPVPQLELEGHVTFNTKGIFYLADTTGLTPVARVAPLFNASGTLGTAGTARLLHDVGNTGDVAGVADYSGRLGFTLRPVPALRLNAWATVTGPYVPLGEPDARTDAYTIANVQVGARVSDRIDLTFGVDNLLDTRAPELRASGAVNPVAPRAVHVSMNTRW